MVYASLMDLVRLTRELIDIESISGNERAVGDSLFDHLGKLGYATEKMVVEDDRFNVLAFSRGSSADVVLSTHMDTVPPFILSSEDEKNIYGRGACDAKGIIASQIAAAEKLRLDGVSVGLLFVVGEERDSLGAKVANHQPRGAKFLINGEPTENRVAVASKGALRATVTAHGKMAHSAYPHLGESAIEKLVEALQRLLKMKLPEDREAGPCTVNIGTIEGGRAPNVIPDFARAQLLYRLIGPTVQLRQEITSELGELADVEFTLDIPFMKFRAFDGLPNMMAAFTTDIPALSRWGEPVLFGPGSIHVAHTTREFVAKKDLFDAVDFYYAIAKKLLS